MTSEARAEPVVSVILTTRDRPLLLSVALRCFAHQTHAERELIVVDDGDRFPVDEAAISAVGGRLLTVTPDTPLGTKLNHGVEAAHGRLCMKMDDDDWYGPDYIETMVREYKSTQTVICRPTTLYLRGFLFFDLLTWELRKSDDYNVPGASLFFPREDWMRRPFRPVTSDEDVWFLVDQVNAGSVVWPVNMLEQYIAIRHRGHGGGRGHTWTHQVNGERLEEYLKDLRLYHRHPEEFLPEWVLEVYRQVHHEIVATLPVAGS